MLRHLCLLGFCNSWNWTLQILRTELFMEPWVPALEKLDLDITVTVNWGKGNWTGTNALIYCQVNFHNYENFSYRLEKLKPSTFIQSKQYAISFRIGNITNYMECMTSWKFTKCLRPLCSGFGVLHRHPSLVIQSLMISIWSRHGCFHQSSQLEDEVSLSSCAVWRTIWSA